MAWILFAAILGGGVVAVLGIAFGFRLARHLDEQEDAKHRIIEIDGSGSHHGEDVEEGPPLIPLDASDVPPEERRRIRIHESGHAIVAKYFGIKVLAVTSVPHRERASNRRMEGVCTIEGMPAFSRRRDYYARIVVKCAGYLAEDLYNDGATDGHEGDLDGVTNTSLMLIHRFGREGECPRGSTFIDNDGAQEVRNQAFRECREILTKEKATFDDLVAALEIKSTLDTTEVDAIWTKHHLVPATPS